MSTSEDAANHQPQPSTSAQAATHELRQGSCLSHTSGTGTRTPRKVQWAETTKGDDPAALQDRDPQLHHHLDEQGLDPEALKQLINALERHQSLRRGPSAPETSRASPPRLSLSTSGLTPGSLSPIASISGSSTGPPSPAPERSVPGEAIIEPLESHGLPAPLPDSQDDETHLLTNPNTERSKRTALRLVKAHANSARFLASFKSRKSRRAKEEEISRDVDLLDSDLMTSRPSGKKNRFGRRKRETGEFVLQDVERSGESRQARPDMLDEPSMGGTGVLSSLLALYGRSNAATPGWMTPSTMATDDTPISTGANTPIISDGEHLHASTSRQPLSSSTYANTNTNASTTANPFSSEKDRRSRRLYSHRTESSSSINALCRTVTEGLDRLGHSVPRSTRAGVSSVSDALNKVPAFNPHPPQARSGAGVFGALITSTGNISGAAAPVNARIAPNLKRTGFHLSRYSVGEDEEQPPSPPKLLPRTESSPTPQILHSRSNSGQLNLEARSSSMPTLGSFMMSGSVPSSTSPSRPDTPPHQYHDFNHNRLSHSGSHTPPSEHTFVGNNVDGKWTDGETSDRDSGFKKLADNGYTNDSMSVTTIGKSGKKRFSGILKDFSRNVSMTPLSAWTTNSSAGGTPEGGNISGSDAGDYWDEKHLKPRRQRRTAEEKKKRKRRKAEIYITRHVAEIIQRQEFILKLARAFMMFGAPSHRLAAQIQATGRVLDLELSCLYLPDVMLISFDDSATSTSNIKFIRQGSALNLSKLQDAYDMYWDVIHDEIAVSDASRYLDVLMQQRPIYPWWQCIIIGGFCSTAICSVSFSGSFVDSLISFPLGALLVAIQILSVRNELYSNVFEITIATLLSFLSAALASTQVFCYSAVASSSVVLILPGFIVLCGSLELSSRNIVAGAVRLCFAVMYALFLGFGLAIGGSIYEKITDKGIIGPEDYSCSISHHPNGPWWQKTPSEFWAFLTVPMYSLFLSLRNQSSYKRKELFITVVISCIGWVSNHFAGKKFVNRNDISSAIGAFAVGLVANIYAKFFDGNAFVIMITGILFQLPSGLGNGGLLTFATQQNVQGESNLQSYLSGFQTALQLISVSIGLTVGLGISLVVVHPIQSRKRAGGVFSL